MKKFYCDKCKEEKQSSDLTAVKLTVGLVGMYSYGDYANIELCTDCLNELGIKSEGFGHAKIEEKNDTDKLYELIQNIVSDCISNQ